MRVIDRDNRSRWNRSTCDKVIWEAGNSGSANEDIAMRVGRGRRCTCWALAAVCLAACGGGSGSAASSTGATSSSATTDKFCAAMLRLEASGTSPAELESAYQDAEAN